MHPYMHLLSINVGITIACLKCWHYINFASREYSLTSRKFIFVTFSICMNFQYISQQISRAVNGDEMVFPEMPEGRIIIMQVFVVAKFG